MVAARLVTSDADVDRAGPRGRRPRLAPAARLARGRPRGTADPAPPDPGRRGLGPARGGQRERPLPRHPPGRDARVGRRIEPRLTDRRAAVPRPPARSWPRPRSARPSSSPAPADAWSGGCGSPSPAPPSSSSLALIAGFVAVGQTGRGPRTRPTAAPARGSSAPQALGDARHPAQRPPRARRRSSLDDTPETQDHALPGVLARHPSLVATSAPVGDGSARLVRSPDGTRLAHGTDADDVVSLVDVATGRVAGAVRRARLRAHTTCSSSRPARSRSARTAARWPSATQSFGSTPLVLPRRPDPRPARPGNRRISRAGGPSLRTSRSPPTAGSSPPRSCCCRPGTSRVDGLPDRTRTLVWDLSHLARRPQVDRAP